MPEFAARAHQSTLPKTVNEAIQESKIPLAKFDVVAFTQGPGLVGSLLVGTSFAKSLAYALDSSLIAVNHMRAHVLANFIEPPFPTFPFICLTVSGGHTQLVLVRDYLCMELLGETKDDAVGEAFDKIGKWLGFPYPGGPNIDTYAQHGDPTRFQFPETNVTDLDFSFSGIKTAFRYSLARECEKHDQFMIKYRNDLCASIQATLVNMLCDKLKLAIDRTGVHTIAIAGGVAANTYLRHKLHLLASEVHGKLYVPKQSYCVDNAAMIAMAAYHQYLANDLAYWESMVRPRLPLSVG